MVARNDAAAADTGFPELITLMKSINRDGVTLIEMLDKVAAQGSAALDGSDDGFADALNVLKVQFDRDKEQMAGRFTALDKWQLQYPNLGSKVGHSIEAVGDNWHLTERLWSRLFDLISTVWSNLQPISSFLKQYDKNSKTDPPGRFLISMRNSRMRLSTT